MANEHEVDPLAQRLKAQLDRSANELDSLTRARLRAMRLRAVAPPARAPWLHWALLGAVAASLVVAIAMHMPAGKDDVTPGAAVAVVPVLVVDDFDLIADADALDLDEDLEFYLWLHAQSGES